MTTMGTVFLDTTHRTRYLDLRVEQQSRLHQQKSHHHHLHQQFRRNLIVGELQMVKLVDKMDVAGIIKTAFAFKCKFLVRAFIK